MPTALWHRNLLSGVKKEPVISTIQEARAGEDGEVLPLQAQWPTERQKAEMHSLTPFISRMRKETESMCSRLTTAISAAAIRCR